MKRTDHPLTISQIKTKIMDQHVDGQDFMYGGLTPNDMDSVQNILNKVKHHDMLIGDVGSGKGTSSALFGFNIQEVGGMVYSVDDFAPHPRFQEVYRKNMEVNGLTPWITQKFMTSASASKLFTDGFFDLVFLDASHWYPEVIKDINLWKPKVRPGGILAGHDYQAYADGDTIDIRRWQDFARETVGYDGIDFHIGVILAVTDTLGDVVQTEGRQIWWVQL